MSLPHDVLCYTIYPVFQNDPIRLWREIQSRIPKDLKNTSQIDDQIVAALRDDIISTGSYPTGHG
jgi:hypothetical protein